MTWRRLLDVLHLKHLAELADERSIRAKNLEELEGLSTDMTAAIRDMSKQARLGSYHRVRIPVRHGR